MDEKQFWNIVEMCNKNEKIYNKLYNTLSQLNNNEIVGFHNIFIKNLSISYKFPVLEACFVIKSYVSDDLFRDFRIWLICQGRKNFFNAIQDPDLISNWPLKREAIDNFNPDDIAGITEEVFLANGGNIDDFDKLVNVVDEPAMNFQWPDSKDAFYEKYPNLVAKFWNQALINEFHPIKSKKSDEEE
ncbi:MAG: DUF4240 domain-containing protein [Planctomycetota bacterium]